MDSPISFINGGNRRGVAWKTLYVTGRPGFDWKMIGRLRSLHLKFLNGSSSGARSHLFWVSNSIDVRKLKLLIGAKLIFVYRMRFFTTMDDLLEYQDRDARNHKFSADQEQMFRDLHVKV